MNDERCYCGDPECGNCFPIAGQERDPDAAYDEQRQAEIDDNF